MKKWKTPAAWMVAIFVILVTISPSTSVTVKPLHQTCRMEIVTSPGQSLLNFALRLTGFGDPTDGMDSMSPEDVFLWKQDFAGRCPTLPEAYKAIPVKHDGQVWQKNEYSSIPVTAPLTAVMVLVGVVIMAGLSSMIQTRRQSTA
jgi:hypothetical protein